MPYAPQQNIPVECQQPHGEVLDLESGTVWQTYLPISKEAYHALDLPKTMIKIGVGTGVMDEHYFRRSPGAAEDGPVSERDIAGLRWFHCANPPEGAKAPDEDGPIKELLSKEGAPLYLLVDKHHSLIFEAGREIDVLCAPDGKEYVPVIAGKSDQAPDLSAMPAGWTLRKQQFADRKVIHLPNPAHAWFFKAHGSFQGPVTLSS